jgi:non-ribosomal peptide synthetase component F
MDLQILLAYFCSRLGESEPDDLANWSPTHTAYPTDACVHQLFEMQVGRTPAASAVIFKDESLTYAELNCRAHQLAWNLVDGVGPDVTVGIFAERSIAVIIGLLGVLKAGGTCLPLDPEYPKERLAFMLQDGDVRFLLVDGQFVERLPENQARIIRLDAANELADTPRKGPHCHVSSENVAYVIYTSGSTGKPKGVEVTHRGIVRLLSGVNFVNLDRTKAVLQLSALTFDGSIFDIWGALLHGARCVLYPGRVPETCERGRFFEQLLVGGEALSVQHIRWAWDHLMGVEIINAYGPTGATVFACSFRSPKEPDPTATSIPIGRPIGNTQGTWAVPALHGAIASGLSSRRRGLFLILSARSPMLGSIRQETWHGFFRFETFRR